MFYAKISRKFFSVDHRLPRARRKVFLCRCLGSIYTKKQTSSCGILRVKIKKCEWEEVVCSNKARLVGDHIHEKANNSGIKFKKSIGVCLCPKRRMARGGGGGLDLWMDSAHSLRRQRELFILPLSSNFEGFRKSASKELRSGRLCVGTKKWWLLPGSNQRPVDYDSIALPTELSRQNVS